jgi:glucuronokinase
MNRELLLNNEAINTEAWAELMNKNFDIRRRLYGGDAIGEANLDMVATVRQFGAGAKLAGSGGAVLVCISAGEPQMDKLLGVLVAFLTCV